MLIEIQLLPAKTCVACGDLDFGKHDWRVLWSRSLNMRETLRKMRGNPRRNSTHIAIPQALTLPRIRIISPSNLSYTSCLASKNFFRIFSLHDWVDVVGALDDVRRLPMKTT